MPLDVTIRKAVAKADRVTAPIQVTIHHYAWLSQDAFGKPVYADPTDILAIVEIVNRQQYSSSGKLMLIVASITIPRPLSPNGAPGRKEPIDPRDKIVLPDGTTQPIIAAEGVLDSATSRPFMTEVLLGRAV